MSSFYDRTFRVISWAQREGLAPEALSEILTRRLRQDKEHWMWCAKRSAAARRLLAELNDRTKFPWPLLIPALEEAGLDTSGDFFDLAGQVLKVVRSCSPGELYDAGRVPLVDLMKEIFDALHDAGHRLATETRGCYSANPYPGGRRSVSNSDRWLEETYPDRPWEK